MPDNQIKVDYIHHCGDDLTTVNAARVSFDKHHEIFDEVGDTRLIHYLAKHGHYSPFGHSFASFRVTAPIFVSRQLVKHKFLRVNEVSRRYVDSKPEFFTPDEWRKKSENKKQGSEGTVSLVESKTTVIKSFLLAADAIYETLLNDGVAPEQARMFLPLATMTSWYWSGSLDAFANMCKLRLKDDTQHETRLVAEQIDTKMRELFPVSWSALIDR